jgi:tryptophan halogenase
MTERRPVRNILIVGGGTAGWMSAVYLATQLSASGGRVTLVESKTIPTVGVGEATVPPLVGFLRLLGISEDEFMRRSHATYKLGIKFHGWHDGADTFWHPFGPVGGDIDGLPLFHYWLKNVRAGHDEGPYTSYSMQALIGDEDRALRPFDRSSPVHDRGQYAYHLDAGAFAEFLKDEAVRRGTRHIVDDVTGVELDDRGLVSLVVTRESGPLTADLYIDCSGFRALIAEQTLGDGYVDWSDVLMCDRAYAAPLKLDGPMQPYTRSTALSAGWAWQIPLSHRVGNGYVYCSRHIEDEAAALELSRFLNVDLDRLQPRKLHMRIGHRKRFWQGNCVAVGLASGFVEPLESTGIFLIQRSLALLLEYFPDTAFEPHLALRYDERMRSTYEEVRDFIVLHYVLTGRRDTEFWRDYAQLALPESVETMLRAYDATSLVEVREHAMFPASSWYCILAGHGRYPRRHHPAADLSNFDTVRTILDAIRRQNRAMADAMPQHREYIERLNRGDVKRLPDPVRGGASNAARQGI